MTDSTWWLGLAAHTRIAADDRDQDALGTVAGMARDGVGRMWVADAAQFMCESRAAWAHCALCLIVGLAEWARGK